MKIIGFHIMAELDDGTAHQVLIKDDQVEPLISCLVLLGGGKIPLLKETPEEIKQKIEKARRG